MVEPGNESLDENVALAVQLVSADVSLRRLAFRRVDGVLGRSRAHA
jgi:hypothetical protein